MAHDEFDYNLVDELRLIANVWSGEGQLASVKVNGKAWQLRQGVYNRNLGNCLALKQNGIRKLEIDAVVAPTNPDSTRGSLSIELYQIMDAFPGAVFLDKTFTVTWTFADNTEHATATVSLL